MKKKFTKLTAALALLALFILPLTGWGQSTYTIGWGTASGEAGTYTNFTDVSGSVSGILSFSTAKEGSQTPPAYNSNSSELRIYYGQSGNGNGGSITITPASGVTITDAVITTSASPSIKYFVDGGTGVSASASNNIYTISDISATASLKIQNVSTSSSPQLRIKTIALTYTTSGGTTQLAVPENFHATAGNSQAVFTWDAVSNASGYTISYTSDGSSWQEEPVTGGSTTNKTITSLTNGTTYTCKIKANGDGTTYSDSEYSSTITVTPTSTQYTVTLNAGNGTVNGETTISWNASMNNGDLPAAEAPCSTWNFGGWSTSAVGTQTTTAPIYVPTHYVPTSDITLYAVYTKTEGGASFDNNTGGDFCIYATVSGTNHYAKGTGSKIESTTDASEATTYTFEKPSGYGEGEWAIKTGNTYITYSSSTNLGTSDTDAYKWIISQQNNNAGTWQVKASTTTELSTVRGLLYSIDNNTNKFGGYAINNAGNGKYFNVEIGGGSTTYYHSTPDCVETVATPTFDPAAGVLYTTTATIHIATTTADANIYYTLNEDEPTSTPSATNFLYNAATGVTISQATTIKAKAFKEGWTASETATASYTFQHDVAEPEMEGEIFTATPYEVIILVPNNTTVYYTTDGTTPTNTSTEYDENDPFTISATTTVKAIAYDTDGCASDVVTATYTRAYTLADAKALYNGSAVDNVTINLAGVQFIAKHGNYTYMQQETTGLLFYGSHSQSLDKGDVFTAGTATGKITKFGENLELTNFTFADVTKEAGTLAASTTDVEITDITGEFSTYESRYIALESLEMDIDNLELSDGTNTLAIYDPLSILDQATQPDDDVVVTGIVTSYYKSNATTYQIVPIALTDITTGLPATLPTLIPAGGATADAAVSTDNVTVTPATNTSVIYTFGSETDEITAATVLTVPSTSATALELVASRDFYNVATATYYYKSSATMYNVTFYVNGTEDNTMAKEVVAGGELGTLQTATAPNGFTFMGWTETEIATIQDAVPTMVTATTPVNNDMTLYAVFALEKEETAGTTNKTLTLVYTDFVTTSYAANNGSHTKDGVSYYTNQIMKSTGKESVQFQKDAGYLYNTTPLNISSIQLNYHTDNAGTFKVYEGTSEHPTTTEISESAGVYTPNGSNQFFTIYCADGTGYLTSIVINYTAVTTNTVYTNYCTTVTILTLGDEVKTYAGACSIDQVDGFIIENGQTLVAGALGNTNPAILIIEDGGQLLTDNAVNVTVEKNIKAYVHDGTDENDADGWYFITAPVTESTHTYIAPTAVTNMTTGTYDLFELNTSTMVWENYQNTENEHHFNLYNGQGYLYANAADVTLKFKGVTMPSSSNTVTLANDGYNLIGNPLVCAATVDVAFGELNNGSVITEKAANSVVMPGAGILVEGSANDEVHFTAVNPDASVAPNNSSLNITLTKANVRSSAVIDNAVVSFNKGQLGKFQFGNSPATICIPQNGKDYAVVSAEAQGEMPVCFKASVNGSYTLSVDAENVEMGYLHLIDNLTGMDVDLLQTPSYTFNARQNDYASRFRLVFSANNAENGNDSFAFISNGQIILTNVDNDATVQVIDALGRMIANTNANNHVYTDNMAPGVYVLRLVNGNDVKTQKIVVK